MLSDLIVVLLAPLLSLAEQTSPESGSIQPTRGSSPLAGADPAGALREVDLRRKIVEAVHQRGMVKSDAGRTFSGCTFPPSNAT